MSLLDPRLLAFYTVARKGSVHAAASELGITQTGVTQRIRSLETQLAVTLFTRSRKGMAPTAEGEALYRYCRAAHDLEGQTLTEISGGARLAEINLTLAGPTSLVSSRLIPACVPIYRKFPNLLLHFRLDDQENRVELLKRGIAQIVVLPPHQVAAEFDSKMLKPDKYLLVASSKWKGRKTSDVIQTERIIDFYESDRTTHQYLSHFKFDKEARADRLFANTNPAIIRLFAAGVGYGTLTMEVAAPYIESGELIALNQKQVFEEKQALAWYPRHEMPAYFKQLLAALH